MRKLAVMLKYNCLSSNPLWVPISYFFISTLPLFLYSRLLKYLCAHEYRCAETRQRPSYCLNMLQSLALLWQSRVKFAMLQVLNAYADTWSAVWACLVWNKLHCISTNLKTLRLHDGCLSIASILSKALIRIVSSWKYFHCSLWKFVQ